MKQPGAALIVLALCLVWPASGSAQEPIRAEGSAGTDKTTAESASSESASSRAEAAGNKQEAMGTPGESRGTEGNLHNGDLANQFAAVVCKDEEAMGGSATAGNLHKEAAAGTEPKFQTIRIGPGQNPADVCRDVHLQPVGLIYKVHVNGVFMAPSASFTTAPAGWDDLEMQLNKDAQMQLDNLAAAKLRNKTPGQKTSGQQPP